MQNMTILQNNSRTNITPPIAADIIITGSSVDKVVGYSKQQQLTLNILMT